MKEPKTTNSDLLLKLVNERRINTEQYYTIFQEPRQIKLEQNKCDLKKLKTLQKLSKSNSKTIQKNQKNRLDQKIDYNKNE